MPARLDLSARAAALHPAADAAPTRGAVSWGGALPPLPSAVRDEVRRTWGLELRHAETAPDPLAYPAFAALYARTRAEQVVLALSSRTNLVLAGATAAVAGDGVLAEAVTATLTRIGARVIRLTDDPIARLRAHLAGLDTAALSDAPIAHYVVATGEHPALPATPATVIVDAAPQGGSFVAADGTTAQVRPHVQQSSSGARIVEIPAPFPDGDGGSGLQWRAADALVALSILVGAGVADTDARLAELVLA